MKKPRRPRKPRTLKSGIGSQKPAYDPPKRTAAAGPLSLVRTALENRPHRT